MGEKKGGQLINTGPLDLNRPRLDLNAWTPDEARMQAFIHLFPMHGQAEEGFIAMLISEVEPQEVRNMFLSVPELH